MATEPNQIKIVFKHEREENISERYPTVEETYYITADEVESMVERDLELRRRDTNDVEKVERRSIDEIIKELNGVDYNCAKKYLRHTSYRSVTSKDDEVELSVVDIAVSHEGGDPTQAWVMTLAVQEALRQLDEKDREVLVGIHVYGFSQAQVAVRMGVSQPAITKRLKKAEARLRELLA